MMQVLPTECNPMKHLQVKREAAMEEPQPIRSGPDMRKYLPRMTFSKGQARPKWRLGPDVEHIAYWWAQGV